MTRLLEYKSKNNVVTTTELGYIDRHDVVAQVNAIMIAKAEDVISDVKKHYPDADSYDIEHYLEPILDKCHVITNGTSTIGQFKVNTTKLGKYSIKRKDGGYTVIYTYYIDEDGR